ncbi:hypothetical protein [Thalassoroseus pseudoceratinae]|uniref:hypothetical protein n=1 Tax=Thalassoroseus pseudoceratinae TaxID=2713176 RepID=UPI001421E5DE|nr:hypothetical protein [Thalassoroseus pseudoceratinae]
MPRVIWIALVWLFCCPGLSRQAIAQTIQQPIVRDFGAATTLSVPDRGTAFIGGVGQSAIGRRQAGFGPWRGSSGIGRATSGGSISATVTIHDCAAMDAYLLQSADEPGPHNVRLRGVAGQAYEQLTNSSVRPTSAHTPRDIPPKPVPAISRAERFFQLGLAAESRGQTGVAKLHFQTAVRLGSQAASDHLRRNSQPR